MKIFLFLIVLLGLLFIFFNYSKKEEIGVIYNNSSNNDIFVNYPKPNSKEFGDFKITGSARGYWYFEASFPVVVYDRNGKILFTTFASAKGDWMTEDFVPFEINIKLGDYKGDVKIVLNKDNPSGISSKDSSVSFVVGIR